MQGGDQDPQRLQIRSTLALASVRLRPLVSPRNRRHFAVTYFRHLMALRVYLHWISDLMFDNGKSQISVRFLLYLTQQIADIDKHGVLTWVISMRASPHLHDRRVDEM